APPRRAAGLALALALAALVAGHRVVRYTTTDAAEYAWAGRWLRTVPAGCRLTWVAFAGPRRTVFLPTWAHRGASAPLDARGPVNVRASLEPLGCTWYLRTTACDTDDGGPACAAVERDLVLAPVAATRFAAKLSHGALPYPRATVRAALFRVTALRPDGPR
ncbi:MAG: uncharacterized protein JWM10_4312, partial [Myxococcaceae bacterium]|nr:uncharacterized protein [Myxococcaceae bacterium]